jgi:hypothetical protein
MTDKIDPDELRADMEAGTPGPWVRDCWDILGLGAGTGAVCEVMRPNDDDASFWMPGEEEANARRIARLPELEQAYLDAIARAALTSGEGE